MNTGTVHYSTIGIFHSFRRPLQLLCRCTSMHVFHVPHFKHAHDLAYIRERGRNEQVWLLSLQTCYFETWPHACELLFNLNGASGRAWCLCTGCKWELAPCRYKTADLHHWLHVSVVWDGRRKWKLCSIWDCLTRMHDPVIAIFQTTVCYC